LSNQRRARLRCEMTGDPARRKVSADPSRWRSTLLRSGGLVHPAIFHSRRSRLSDASTIPSGSPIQRGDMMRVIPTPVDYVLARSTWPAMEQSTVVEMSGHWVSAMQRSPAACSKLSMVAAVDGQVVDEGRKMVGRLELWLPPESSLRLGTRGRGERWICA
jgi:hypothetical protein